MWMNRTRIQRPSHPQPSLLAGYPGVMLLHSEVTQVLKRALAICGKSMALVFAAVFLYSVPLDAQASEKKAVLDTCAKLFGPSLDAKQNLFEVNHLFALQAKFDSHDELTELAVFPKYFVEESHPEWAEPNDRVYLSRSEYESLLSRLDTIKSKGRLIHSVENGAITNSTERYLDQHEHGFLNWFEWWDWDRADNFKWEVRFFYLHFFHPIEGKVKKKRECRYCYGGRCPAYYYVVVGGCGYFVRRATYSRLKVGRPAKLLAAGPFEGMCGGGVECGP